MPNDNNERFDEKSALAAGDLFDSIAANAVAGEICSSSGAAKQKARERLQTIMDRVSKLQEVLK